MPHTNQTATAKVPKLKSGIHFYVICSVHKMNMVECISEKANEKSNSTKFFKEVRVKVRVSSSVG